jgi:hypothetical protein
MKESFTIAKDADRKKDISSTRSGNSIRRVRNEPEKQLGSLRSVIGNIRHDGSTPSLDSIATELSSMHAAQRASVLLALQRTHGNRYVQRVVTGIQAKLKVGQPGDIYEQEADRVADEVMRMSEPLMQQQTEEEEEDLIQTEPIAEQITSLVQRQAEKEKEILQTRKNPGQTPKVTPDLEPRIHAIRGSGQPLPESVRAFFEPRFGYDFSQVRVHTDAQNAETARALNSQAFTVGQNVVFGAGQYAPRTSERNKLLAHELVHVIQQQQATPLARAGAAMKQGPRLKTGAGEKRARSELRNISSAVHGISQYSIQRLPESKVELVGKTEPTAITIEKAGTNVYKVRFLGVVIATVKFFRQKEQKLEVHFPKIPEEPGKPPRVRVILDCFPYVRIRLHGSAIKSFFGKRGIILEVAKRPVGIEVSGGVESGFPVLPPRETEVIKGTAPEEEAAPSPPREAKEPEVTAPEEPTTSILTDLLEKLRTKLERERIKALLNKAARLMAEGKDYKWVMAEAAEIALGILERKTAAFDPRSVKKKMAQELIRITEDVMLLGGGESAVETAMKKVVDWAEVRLASAVESLEETPTEAVASQVAEKAGLVMLLGGDAIEALDLLMTQFPHRGRKLSQAK